MGPQTTKEEVDTARQAGLRIIGQKPFWQAHRKVNPGVDSFASYPTERARWQTLEDRLKTLRTKKSAFAFPNRMLAGAALGAIPGAGIGAALSDKEHRGRGAVLGGLAGGALGAGGGALSEAYAARAAAHAAHAAPAAQAAHAAPAMSEAHTAMSADIAQRVKKHRDDFLNYHLGIETSRRALPVSAHAAVVAEKGLGEAVLSMPALRASDTFPQSGGLPHADVHAMWSAHMPGGMTYSTKNPRAMSQGIAEETKQEAKKIMDALYPHTKTSAFASDAQRRHFFKTVRAKEKAEREQAQELLAKTKERRAAQSAAKTPRELDDDASRRARMHETGMAFEGFEDNMDDIEFGAM